MIWFYSIASVVVVSLVALVGLFTLSVREETLKKFVFVLVSVSVGALFGDAFIHLLPEVYNQGEKGIFPAFYVLLGVFVFFVLEKFLNWRHCHGADEETEETIIRHNHCEVRPLGSLVLFSDSVHNFIDGVIIGASYLVGIEVGLATTVAVILHEIPQEIAHFGLLLHAGYKRLKALFFNFVSALTALVGVLVPLSLGVGDGAENFVVSAAAFTAGSFIYIAGSDLVPELHKISEVRKSIIQVVSIIAGVAIMFVLLFVE